MNKKLAAGSGIGLVIGALLGILLDPMFGSNGMAMVLGGTLGIVLGAGVAATSSRDSKDSLTANEAKSRR